MCNCAMVKCFYVNTECFKASVSYCAAQDLQMFIILQHLLDVLRGLAILDLCSEGTWSPFLLSQCVWEACRGLRSQVWLLQSVLEACRGSCLSWLPEWAVSGRVSDIHQPNVIQEVGHKPRWRRAGGEEGKGERGGSKRRGRKRQTWNLVHTTQMLLPLRHWTCCRSKPCNRCNRTSSENKMVTGL